MQKTIGRVYMTLKWKNLIAYLYLSVLLSIAPGSCSDIDHMSMGMVRSSSCFGCLPPRMVSAQANVTVTSVNAGKRINNTSLCVINCCNIQQMLAVCTMQTLTVEQHLSTTCFRRRPLIQMTLQLGEPNVTSDIFCSRSSHPN